jgi:DNA gyrase subunit A
MEVVETGADLLVITTQGFGKRTPLSDYPSKNRAIAGIQTIDKKALRKIGLVTSARIVQEADDLTIISSNGVVLRTKVKSISQTSRATRGVSIMKMQEGDSVASLARVAYADLRRVGAASEENGQPQNG